MAVYLLSAFTNAFLKTNATYAFLAVVELISSDFSCVPIVVCRVVYHT